MELALLKKNYDLLAKKYKLPSFQEMNEDYEIERISQETESLLRVIRKIMIEKVVGWLRFYEMIMNPSNAPRIYLAYIKSMTLEDKQIIDEIYDAFGEINVKALNLEIEYNEKSEADMIKYIVKTLKTFQPKMKIILEHLQNPPAISKKEKNYFG